MIEDDTNGAHASPVNGSKDPDSDDQTLQRVAIAAKDLLVNTPATIPTSSSIPKREDHSSRGMQREKKRAKSNGATNKVKAVSDTRIVRPASALAMGIPDPSLFASSGSAGSLGSPGSITAVKTDPTRSAKIEDDLSQEAWDAVKHSYLKTGVRADISRATGLQLKHVNHILDCGIVRLGLPPVIEAVVSLNKLSTEAAKIFKETSLAKNEDASLTEPGPGGITKEEHLAVQERVSHEAAATRKLLMQTLEVGNVLNELVQAFVRGVETQLVPEAIAITPDNIEVLTKVIETHSRTVERAVKLSRLTHGEPTDLIGVQIGVMLDACTTEELEEAAMSGKLPKRLTARVSAAFDDDPRAQPIDVSYVEVAAATKAAAAMPSSGAEAETEMPIWQQELFARDGEGQK